jgi:hypothetical protein
MRLSAADNHITGCCRACASRDNVGVASVLTRAHECSSHDQQLGVWVPWHLRSNLLDDGQDDHGTDLEKQAAVVKWQSHTPWLLETCKYSRHKQ